MRRFRKKQKILYIIAAAVFALLGIGILFFLLISAAPDKPAGTDPAPNAAAATAAPAGNTILVAGKEVDPAADSFDLSGRPLSEQDMAEITSLKELTTLSLTNCGLVNVSFLSELPRLRTLYLPDNRINDLTPLAGLTELRTVYLDRNPLTDLTPLTKLPALTTLSIQGVTIADYVLSDLKEAMPDCHIFSDSVVEEPRPVSLGGLAFTEDVEVLDLAGRDVEDISKLNYCLQLRELDLSGNRVRDYSVLAGLPKLSVLTLTDADLTDEQLRYFSALQQLTYLDLRNNPQLTAEGLDALEKALPDCQVFHDTVYYIVELGGHRLTSDAQELDLTGAGLRGIEGMEKFTMLRRLSIHGNAVADLGPLAGIMTLEELDAGYNSLQDISPLAGHTPLRKLDLSYNGIRDLSPLSDCVSLEELDLNHNQLTDLTMLYRCTALRKLDVSYNQYITADQIRKLQEALPWCAIATDVDLSMPEPTPPPPAEENSPAPEASAAPGASASPAPIPEDPAPIPEYPDPIPVGTPAP